MCSRRRSEAQKTLAKREVGAILCRRHIHKYVEKQNREIPISRDSKDFQAAVDVYCTIWVKRSRSSKICRSGTLINLNTFSLPHFVRIKDGNPLFLKSVKQEAFHRSGIASADSVVLVPSCTHVTSLTKRLFFVRYPMHIG